MHLPHSLPPALKNFSWKHLMFFWYRHYKALFFFGFLVVLGFGSLVWYGNLYQYRWSDERKQEYLNQHFQATVFEERAFTRLVESLRSRVEAHKTAPKLSRNIFTGEAIGE